MATVARTKQDVDNMTKQERLWDSLNHAYGQQRESSDKSFDRAYSQADRQALSRGMQRSSYNAQNLANINQQKIEAQNNIWNNQIADYENRLGALESEEAEAERWERQFEANRADVAWNQNFQQGQADLAAQQWEREFTRGTDSADRQLAASYVSAIVAQGGTPSDDLLARAGLSRADAEAMRKGATGGSNGGPGPSNPGSDTPPADNPDDFLDDDLKTTAKGLLGNVGSFLNLNAQGAIANSSVPYTPPAKRPAIVDNNNGNPNRYQSPNNVTIDPIEAAFLRPEEEYYEVDLDEKNNPRALGKSKTTSDAGGKIKSTVTKKSN